MKCKIPEISWHNRDPVLSVDIQMNGQGLRSPTICRLASGGTDAHVLIWYVNRCDNGDGVDLELAVDLSRHQRAVNTVRWSPNGELLASGDDESVVFIWKQKADHEVVNILDADAGSQQDKESWMTLKVLRGHREDIYDLSWSPNSQFLVTGSVDNTAMVWDVYKGKSLAILEDHKGYVQGVAWDPCNQFIATMSTDRQLRIFDTHTKRVLHRVSKCTLPVKEGHAIHGKNIRLYHDGSLQTFFRRLCFTPDGKLLITPAGITDYDGVLKPVNTTYGFSRYDLTRPAFVLPFPQEYAVAVRCSPVLYCLRPYNVDKNPPVISLPYRMIYAVATKNSVFFYDTQQPVPFAIVSNIHYTRLTDLTWSSDGTVLIVSSTDGFCSLLYFEIDELGDRYEEMDAVLCAALKSSENAPPPKKKKVRARKVSADERPSTTRKPLQEKTKPNLKRKTSESDIKEVREIDIDAENDSSMHSASSSISTSPKQKTKAEVEVKPKPISFRRSPRKVTATTIPAPIAIRRSPRKPEDSEVSASQISVKRKIGSGTTDSQTPTPIPIRRSPRKTEDTEALPISGKRKISPLKEPPTKKHLTTIDGTAVLDNKIVTHLQIPTHQMPDKTEDLLVSVKRKSSPMPEPPTKKHQSDIAGIAVLDKEIISSEEKFESPEKKCRPATPIQVRRQPRTPGSSSSFSLTPKSQPAKTATPIAVRRTPRVLVEMPVNSPVAPMEEAMDAWPLEEESTPMPTSMKETLPETNEKAKNPVSISESTCEHTEDIRLVYEDTQEEAQTPIKATVAKPSTPNSKTPRRVSLRTISTPKSKKKLLE
ncbi:LOW QUALITY PROTEIN: chromatin assembly factor 1 subunit B [Drosophila obscura]|uniref:LOW QUALITY PROTEIN: chromatin assembly factor 1 subunit B n=1 Tax=Drosophila obscura TaxID=7282 RepID=UPI001BB15BBD|nr:LOW QUALITY PROTEIN: chromatin assembly factor 1 subunit B [Drosophila obscura]